MGIDYVKMRRAQRRDCESIRRVLAESIREAAASEYAHDKDLSKCMYLASWPIGLRVRVYTGLYYGRTETDRKKTDPLRRC
jgi:hypothetical protein